MNGAFDYFVLLAEMRTGSNFLETNLNEIDGLSCHGEAFNPHFIGYPKRREILKVTRPERDADPARLIAAIRQGSDGLGGFRFFHDHDPRALDLFLDDPRCAKIILTRNPLDSYLSLKIAQATGQWKLTDAKRRKAGRAVFDGVEFERHVQDHQAFQLRILNRLQISGQTAFYLAYEDLQDIEILNGLAKWLGVSGRLQRLDQSLKPQNPLPLDQRVENFEDMVASVDRLDPFNLSRTPNFEPRRGPAIPTYVAAARSGLLYMPLSGQADAAVLSWMADLDGVGVQDLPTGLSQRQLRHWKRQHPAHRSFTVLTHPVARAHAAFCAHVLQSGPGTNPQLRKVLLRQLDLEMPDRPDGETLAPTVHRKAFDAFLDLVKASIVGQSPVRADPAWGTQAAALANFSAFAPPDHILRDGELPRILPLLLPEKTPPPVFRHPDASRSACSLAEIYDDSLESRVADVYRRDYMMFGFGPWRNA